VSAGAAFQSLAVMAQAGQSAANTIVGRGAPGGGADADGLALAHQSFKDLELALGRLDLTSEVGQRDGISLILAVGDCVLATRILLHPYPKTSDLASTRNATCVAINGLRPQLFNYFNHVLRLDTSGPVAVIPAHMKRYVFAKPTSREDSDSLMAQFVRFEFDQMDYFMQPHGAGSWALCVNVGSAVEAISKPNYFVQQSNLERIRDFVNVLLVSIGVPQVAPVAPNPALQGYSWPAFVDFYITKLKLAAGLPLLLDQYLHIAACVKIFESALTAMRQRLISLVRDPDPSSRTMQAFIFPPDGSVIQDLTSLGTEISRKRNARGGPRRHLTLRLRPCRPPRGGHVDRAPPRRHLVAVVTADLAASAVAQQPTSHPPPSLNLDEVRLLLRGADAPT
jgi:hypothetical protein